MRFSIIVPVYNAEKYLRESVDSVLSQSCEDWELILSDDGSEKKCADLCDALAAENRRVRVIRQKNQGPLVARLNGIEAAKGEYCVFLDADDAFVPDGLACLNSAIGRNNEPDALIYSFYYETSEGSRRESPLLFPKERSFSGTEKKELYRLFVYGSGLNSVWTKAVKREVFYRERPDYSKYSHLRCAEDRLLSMAAVSQAETVVYLPEFLYRYRQFPGSATRQFSRDALDRFNTCALYPFETECVLKWGLDTEESMLRLKASYVAQALYVLDRFYMNISDSEERNKLIRYPWRELVPDDCSDSFEANPYLNDVQKNLFSMLLAEDTQGIERHFKRKTRIKKIRDMKKKLFS